MREMISLKILRGINREYYEQLFPNKFRHLGEMDKFFGR